jgi:diacylglycerol kinase (ATP)
VVSNSYKKVLFVINPKSGNYHDYRPDISKAAEKFNFKRLIYLTRGKNDSKVISRHIKKFKPEAVISIGGDGTVNMVACELIGTGINLGIIPTGSANGLAYNLGIPEDFDAAMKKIFSSPPGPLDLISINDKYFCLHLCDIGINARIVKRFEEEGAKGLIGYGKQLFKELLEGKTYFSFFINMPGKIRKKYNAEMLVIANAKSFGTGATINPGGIYNDGRFEVVVIRPYPWWFVFNFLFALFTNKLHKMKYIKVFSLTEATITLPEPHECQVDGEILPEISSLKLKIIPNGLNVIGA